MDVNAASHKIITDLLRARTGQHMAEGRRWRIDSALAGLYRERGIENVDQLVCLLAQARDSSLATQVVEALLNNETYFFRDRAMFDELANRALPCLHERHADRKSLSIWSAGCSTGQEVFSLAMLFADQASRWKGWTVQILGTDVSARAVNAAREAQYSQFEIQRGLGVTQMMSYFAESSRGWKADDRLRTMTRFRQHNLLEGSPSIEKFDLVLCRNVLLYFDMQTRRAAFDSLGQAMAPEGWLMLGAGETVVGQTTRFESVLGAPGLYRPVAAEAGSREGTLVRMRA